MRRCVEPRRSRLMKYHGNGSYAGFCQLTTRRQTRFKLIPAPRVAVGVTASDALLCVNHPLRKVCSMIRSALGGSSPKGVERVGTTNRNAVRPTGRGSFLQSAFTLIELLVVI